MNEEVVNLAAIVAAVICGGIAVFQLLIVLGSPLGEYSWGGKYKGVLPAKFRILSLSSVFLLCFMGYVFLLHAKVIVSDQMSLPTNILTWVFTAFLGLNTLGNLASPSKKERLVMTPVAGLAFVLCFIVSTWG